MKLEIRQAKPEEMDEFRRVVQTALTVFPAPDNFTHDLTLCGFKDGKLAASYGAWNLMVRINGADVPVAGVTMVGTLPVYRRLGCLRQITSRHFELLHEKGEQPVAALYASRAAIYRRYGYSVVVTHNTYKVEPRYIQFIAGKEPKGSFREAGESDTDTLTLLYDRFIADRTGYLRRNTDMWKRRLNPTPREGHLQSKVIYEEDGEPQGYVIYTASAVHEGRNKPGQNIWIGDMAWLTPSAYRAIWELFSRMDIAFEITWGGAPSDDPLPHLLMEPRMLNKTSRDAVLARIVDVERAMDKRGYDAEGILTFRIIDKLCPWNEGTWKLETSPGEATIKHTDEEPQLEMPISTLALLYLGQLSSTEAARMGRLDVLVPDSLASWDRVMETRYKPGCADMF